MGLLISLGNAFCCFIHSLLLLCVHGSDLLCKEQDMRNKVLKLDYFEFAGNAKESQNKPQNNFSNVRFSRSINILLVFVEEHLEEDIIFGE